MSDSISDIVNHFESASADILRVYKDKKFNVAVIGTGDDCSIGSAIVDHLSLNTERVKKLVISNRFKPNAEWLDTNMLANSSVKICNYEEMNKWLFGEKIDISIICAGKFFDDRNEELENNAKHVIPTIAPQFNGYKGSTIIVTNPVDTMAYQFAVLSGCNPYSIMGFSQLSPERGLKYLKEHFKAKFGDIKNIENFLTIGAHNLIKKPIRIECMIPYLHLAKINDLPLKEFFFEQDYLSLKKIIGDYGDEQYHMLEKANADRNKGTASKLAGKVMSEQVLEAFANPSHLISMSVWRPKLGESGIYATWPTRISDLLAVPAEEIDISSPIYYKRDFKEVCDKVLIPNIQVLRELCIEGKPVLEGEPVKADNRCPDYREKLDDLIIETDKKIHQTKCINSQDKRLKEKYVNELRPKTASEISLIAPIKPIDVQVQELEKEKQSVVHIKPAPKVHLYSRNIEGFSSILVYDLFEDKFVREITFSNANKYTRVVGIKSLDDQIFALFGNEKKGNPFVYSAYKINPDSFKLEQIGEFESSLIAGFDVSGNKIFLGMYDDQNVAVRVNNLKDGKELKKYRGDSGVYQGVRVIKQNGDFDVAAVMKKDVYLWRDSKNPSKIICRDYVSENISLVKSNGENILAYCSDGRAYFRKFFDDTTKNHAGIEAKDNQVSLSVDDDVINAFVVNPHAGVERWYSKSFANFLKTSELERETAKINFGNQNAYVRLINSTQDSVVIATDDNFLLFGRNPLSFVKTVEVENADRECCTIRQF